LAHTPANPVLGPLLGFLKSNVDAVSEFELMLQLKPYLKAAEPTEDSQLVLFQNHFLIMNALYQLQEKLQEEGKNLFVSPLKIYLESIGSSDEKYLTKGDVNPLLKSYYLDWDNFIGTSADDVETLLDGFWRQYLVSDKRADALVRLGLDADASWKTIRSRYRSLAAKNHPDKGGNILQFIEVREAYEILSDSNEQKTDGEI